MTDQAVAKWEKARDKPVSKPAERLLRGLYLHSLDGKSEFSQILARLADLDAEAGRARTASVQRRASLVKGSRMMSDEEKQKPVTIFAAADRRSEQALRADHRQEVDARGAGAHRGYVQGENGGRGAGIRMQARGLRLHPGEAVAGRLRLFAYLRAELRFSATGS